VRSRKFGSLEACGGFGAAPGFGLWVGGRVLGLILWFQDAP
jgi:hypothetical protein